MNIKLYKVLPAILFVIVIVLTAVYEIAIRKHLYSTCDMSQGGNIDVLYFSITGLLLLIGFAIFLRKGESKTGKALLIIIAKSLVLAAVSTYALMAILLIFGFNCSGGRGAMFF
jgi:hypothetical protein